MSAVYNLACCVDSRFQQRNRLVSLSASQKLAFISSAAGLCHVGLGVGVFNGAETHRGMWGDGKQSRALISTDPSSCMIYNYSI